MRSLLLAVVFVRLLPPAEAPRLPNWLQSAPGAHDVSTQRGPKSVIASYQTGLAPAAVTAHYLKQIRAAGLDPQENFDGIGASIRILAQGASGVVRVRDADPGSQVRVQYAITGILVPHSKSDGTCRESERIYYSQVRATAVCSEAAPLQLDWPVWLQEVPGGKLTERSPEPAPPPGWYPGSFLSRRYESVERLEDLYEYFRLLLKDRGFKASGQIDAPEPFLHGMQRPVRNIALDPRHLLPEYANVLYVRQVHITFARSAAGTVLTILVQVHNPAGAAESSAITP